MSIYADSNYSFNPWMRDLPGGDLRPPELLRAEEVVAEIANQVPMPLPASIQPRFGAEKTALTIEEVLRVPPRVLQREQDKGQQGYGGPALGKW